MSSSFETVVATLRLLGGARRWRWAILVLLGIVVAGFEAAGAVLVYQLVALATGGDTAISLPGSVGAFDLRDRFGSSALQVVFAAAVTVFFLARAGLVIVQRYIKARVVHSAGCAVAGRLVRGYLALPYIEHTQRNSAELVRNAFDSVEVLEREVMNAAVDVAVEIVLVCGLITLLLWIAPREAAVALLALGPAVLLLQARVQPRVKRLGRRSKKARKATLQAMQQALAGMREIRLLGREDVFAGLFSTQRMYMARAEYRKVALSQVTRTVLESLTILLIVGVLVATILVAGDLARMAATLGAFTYVGLRLQPSLQKIVQGLNHMRFGSAVLEDLLEDRQRADAALAVQARPTLASSLRLDQCIELQNVSFTYGPDAKPAVRDINLVIRKGEFVGICGPTGGGKSTLIDLIVGLLQPTSGTVLVDGQALGEHPGWWYAVLGVVSQNVYLLDDTIRRNIAFGCRDEEIDEELLQRCIVRAQLTTVISNLPEGLNTVTGERGVRLSGGQRQRVAVARALYREPSVIVFDEGTAALDAATEAALVAALDELKAGRTLISVAHRIATVRHADRIVVVQDGRIADSGTYDELRQSSPVFQMLSS
jgi:ATP-binding cassette, subfamily B, bacterial PglK